MQYALCYMIMEFYSQQYNYTVFQTAMNNVFWAVTDGESYYYVQFSKSKSWPNVNEPIRKAGKPNHPNAQFFPVKRRHV